MQPETKEVVLVKYSFILQPDGQLRSEVDSINPDEFLKAANEADPEWEDAPTITTALKYLLTQIKELDKNFDTYLAAL